MADQAQVSRADLEQAVSWILNSQTNILNIQRNLDTANLDLKVHWVGASRQAFEGVHKLWHERMDLILTSLANLAQTIQDNNKNYDLFNQEEEQRINKIAQLIAADPSQFVKQ
ncbi:WXG100 family type VII secretion target [Nonomuraea sp. NPDC046570]|uniref:WXG100 family type VII secretion target n=1 Tax=Nonomuraea sp. NPDC046570 TaxID=3155255 RepID=UPI0033E36385